MEQITDPGVLSQLNGFDQQGQITDPGILAQLNASGSMQQPSNGMLGDIPRYASDITSGLANAGQTTHNFLVSALNAIPGVNIPKTNINFEQLFNAPQGNNANLADTLVKGAASYAPYAPLAELGGAANAAELAGPWAANYMRTSPYMSNLLNQVLPGALTGTINDPNSPGTGAAVGAGTAAITSGAGKLLSKMMPSNFLRGTLSPEQLQQNANLSQGTPTPLGDVIQNPLLKQFYENFLAKMPFSGVSNNQQNIAKELVNQGSDILSNLGSGNTRAQVPGILQEGLDSAYNAARNNKIDNFSGANNQAQQEGFQLNTNDFGKAVNKYSNQLQGSGLDSDTAQLLDKVRNSPNVVPSNTGITSTQTIYPTLEDAGLLKGKLNQLSSRYSSSPLPADRNLAGIYGNLAGALKSDINSSLENQGSPQLQSMWKNAETSYAKDFSPFLDKNIYKFINGDADSDTLVNSFVKGGSSDRANLAQKLMSVLPPEMQDLVGFHLLSKPNASGEVNAATIAKNFKSLGPNQQETIFPNEDNRNLLQNFSNKVGMNKSSLDTMFNPKTGQVLSTTLPLGIAMAGHSIAGPAGFVGAPLIASGVSKVLAKALTSEKIRNSLIQKMISNQQGPGNIQNLSPYLTQPTAQNYISGNQ